MSSKFSVAEISKDTLSFGSACDRGCCFPCFVATLPAELCLQGLPCPPAEGRAAAPSSRAVLVQKDVLNPSSSPQGAQGSDAAWVCAGSFCIAAQISVPCFWEEVDELNRGIPKAA